MFCCRQISKGGVCVCVFGGWDFSFSSTFCLGNNSLPFYFIIHLSLVLDKLISKYFHFLTVSFTPLFIRYCVAGESQSSVLIFVWYFLICRFSWTDRCCIVIMIVWMFCSYLIVSHLYICWWLFHHKIICNSKYCYNASAD